MTTSACGTSPATSTKFAWEVPQADVVTLDKVLCCYADMPRLVDASASKARRLYGFVVPKDNALNRLLRRVLNFTWMLMRSPFRNFTHRIGDIDARLRRNGLRLRAQDRTFAWRIFVYERA